MKSADSFSWWSHIADYAVGADISWTEAGAKTLI